MEIDDGRRAAELDDVPNVRIRNAGGLNSRLVLVTHYVPRKGHKRTIQSNHTRYGKSWASRQEITKGDKLAFLQWVNTGLSNPGVGGSSTRLPPWLTESASRSSARLQNNLVAVVHSCDQVVAHVEGAVLQCLKHVVDMVVRQARFHSVGVLQRGRYVPGKRSHQKTDVVSASAVYRPLRMTRRMRAAPRKLTQRKRGSKGYNYRDSVLKRAHAARVEQDVEWLQRQRHRLATVVARQDLHELLPEGA